MAKQNKSQLDDCELEDIETNDTPETSDEADATDPNVAKLLAGPKTKDTGGEGTGGRKLVYCPPKSKEGGSGTVRGPAQGDQVRPQCPRCTNDQVAVLCVAYSSPSNGQTFTTRYKCPLCNFTAQKMRPGIAAQFKQQAQRKPTKPFVERP